MRFCNATWSPNGGRFSDKEGSFQVFFVIHGFKCRFPGLLVSTEPRNLRAVAQQLGRLVRHMFCCGLAGGFWARPFLKSTSTDFGRGGLVQAVLERACGRW
jgi:hypothetical protein